MHSDGEGLRRGPATADSAAGGGGERGGTILASRLDKVDGSQLRLYREEIDAVRRVGTLPVTLEGDRWVHYLCGALSEHIRTPAHEVRLDAILNALDLWSNCAVKPLAVTLHCMNLAYYLANDVSRVPLELVRHRKEAPLHRAWSGLCDWLETVRPGQIPSFPIGRTGPSVKVHRCVLRLPPEVCGGPIAAHLFVDVPDPVLLSMHMLVTSIFGNDSYVVATEQPSGDYAAEVRLKLGGGMQGRNALAVREPGWVRPAMIAGVTAGGVMAPGVVRQAVGAMRDGARIVNEIAAGVRAASDGATVIVDATRGLVQAVTGGGEAGVPPAVRAIDYPATALVPGPPGAPLRVIGADGDVRLAEAPAAPAPGAAGGGGGGAAADGAAGAGGGVAGGGGSGGILSQVTDWLSGVGGGGGGGPGGSDGAAGGGGGGRPGGGAVLDAYPIVGARPAGGSGVTHLGTGPSGIPVDVSMPLYRGLSVAPTAAQMRFAGCMTVIPGYMTLAGTTTWVSAIRALANNSVRRYRYRARAGEEVQFHCGTWSGGAHLLPDTVPNSSWDGQAVAAKTGFGIQTGLEMRIAYDWSPEARAVAGGILSGTAAGANAVAVDANTPMSAAQTINCSITLADPSRGHCSYVVLQNRLLRYIRTFEPSPGGAFDHAVPTAAFVVNGVAGNALPVVNGNTFFPFRPGGGQQASIVRGYVASASDWAFYLARRRGGALPLDGLGTTFAPVYIRTTGTNNGQMNALMAIVQACGAPFKTRWFGGEYVDAPSRGGAFRHPTTFYPTAQLFVDTHGIVWGADAAEERALVFVVVDANGNTVNVDVGGTILNYRDHHFITDATGAVGAGVAIRDALSNAWDNARASDFARLGPVLYTLCGNPIDLHTAAVMCAIDSDVRSVNNFVLSSPKDSPSSVPTLHAFDRPHSVGAHDPPDVFLPMSDAAVENAYDEPLSTNQLAVVANEACFNSAWVARCNMYPAGGETPVGTLAYEAYTNPAWRVPEVDYIHFFLVAQGLFVTAKDANDIILFNNAAVRTIYMTRVADNINAVMSHMCQRASIGALPVMYPREYPYAMTDQMFAWMSRAAQACIDACVPGGVAACAINYAPNMLPSAQWTWQTSFRGADPSQCTAPLSSGELTDVEMVLAPALTAPLEPFNTQGVLSDGFVPQRKDVAFGPATRDDWVDVWGGAVPFQLGKDRDKFVGQALQQLSCMAFDTSDAVVTRDPLFAGTTFAEGRLLGPLFVGYVSMHRDWAVYMLARRITGGVTSELDPYSQQPARGARVRVSPGLPCLIDREFEGYTPLSVYTYGSRGPFTASGDSVGSSFSSISLFSDTRPPATTSVAVGPGSILSLPGIDTV